MFTLLKKESGKREERRERAEGGKSNVLFVFFAIQDPGGKAAKRTSDKSGY